MGPPFICDQRKRKYVCICKIPWMYSNYTWEANNWKKDPKQHWIKWPLCVLNLIFRSVLKTKVKFFQSKNSHLLEKQYGGGRNPLIVVGSKSFESVSQFCSISQNESLKACVLANSTSESVALQICNASSFPNIQLNLPGIRNCQLSPIFFGLHPKENMKLVYLSSTLYIRKLFLL